MQSFYATVNPLGEARPAWKVLRVLGSLLGRAGFDFDSIDQVRAACLGDRDISALLSNRIVPSCMKTAPPMYVEGNGAPGTSAPAMRR